MTAARWLALGVPLLAVVAAARLERDRRGHAAALLAFIAAGLGIAVLHEVAQLTGWYAFAPVAGAWRGMPVDLWLGWAALWGALPVLLRRLLPLPATLGLLLWLDVVVMPALHPLVVLRPHWLVGEIVGLAGVALPAQLLGRWSADARHLRARVLLQVAVFATLVLWFLPMLAFELGDGAWYRLTRLALTDLLVLVQVVLLVATPALLAVREFAERGRGTPYPWDPPVRIVTTGPYAYLANPMQVSATALLLVTATAARSLVLLAVAVGTAAFSAAVARPHEEHDLARRHGEDWRAWRRSVRDWWPRWRPYASGEPAVLRLDAGCGPCAAVWRFVERRDPVNLTILPADGQLRAEYGGGDGHTERGVAAVARGLEHLNLGWAFVGWTLRLPGVTWLAQLVTDAMIAPPHAAGGKRCPTPSDA